MEISIVVPTFNQGQFIEECLLSVLSQTHKDFEVIIQDSLSTDGTEIICRKYETLDGRIKYYREKDSGQSDAINKGLTRSSGKLWTWLCSDDYFSSPDALTALIKAFETEKATNNKVIGCFGTAEHVSENGQYLQEYFTLKKNLVREDFISLWPLAQPSLIVETSKVKALGGVDVGLELGMDLDLFIRLLAENCQFNFVNQRIACIRDQPNSKTVRQPAPTLLTALQLIYRHFGTIGNPDDSIYIKTLYSLAHNNTPLREKTFLSKLLGRFYSL